MGSERRRYPRLAIPLDGTWTGASGAATCRIADISWGGCFIQTKAEPRIGESTEVTIGVGEQQVSVKGIVVHIDRPIGFSVQFDDMSAEQVEGLKPLLGPKE